MQTSQRVWWIVVGGLAVLGGYWAVIRTLQETRASGEWLAYAALALGGALGGVAMTACAPLRPTREPAAAALVSIAIMMIVFIAAPHPWFYWTPAHASIAWLVVVAAAAMTAASAIAGAFAARALVPRLASTLAIVFLSSLVSMASIVILGAVLFGFLHADVTAGAIWLLVFPTFAVVGFLVQAVIPHRRPWTCAFGAVAWLAWFGMIGAPVAKAVPGLAILMPVMYAGARLGWRVVARHHALDHVDAHAVARVRG